MQLNEYNIISKGLRKPKSTLATHATKRARHYFQGAAQGQKHTLAAHAAKGAQYYLQRATQGHLTIACTEQLMQMLQILVTSVLETFTIANTLRQLLPPHKAMRLCHGNDHEDSNRHGTAVALQLPTRHAARPVRLAAWVKLGRRVKLVGGDCTYIGLDQ